MHDEERDEQEAGACPYDDNHAAGDALVEELAENDRMPNGEVANASQTKTE